MQRYLKTCFGVLIGLWLFAACVDKIDLQPLKSSERLVIKGSIENYARAYEVEIYLTGNLNGELEVPVNTAGVFLRDESGNEDELLNVSPGQYETQPDGDIIGQVGSSYKLIVEYDGSTYESPWETILPPTQIDSVSFIADLSQYRNDQGGIYTKEEFFLFSHFSITDDDVWLRWDIENIYVIPQIPCSPFAPNHICYVPREERNARPFALWDGNLSAKNSATTTLLQTQDIDVVFGMPQYFNVYQRRIDKEAFEYWTKINAVLDNDESIFATQPSLVRGNLRNIIDPNEVVLGNFEAVSVDTARVYVTGQTLNLGRTLNGICGVPGFRPWPLPPECCNCLSLPNSTLEKPDWWN